MKEHQMLQHLTLFHGAPNLGQFAKNGAWEQAWSFLCDGLPDERSVRTYLDQSTEVAFEAFWEDAFFGARFTGEAAVAECFAIKCVQALRAGSSGESFFTAFCDYLQLDHLGREPIYAEIGSVNAWRSVGACRIADPQGALADFDHLWEELMRSPVGQDTHHRKAFEFAFEHPLPHWFGIPVSRSEMPHAISPDLLREALGAVAGRQEQ